MEEWNDAIRVACNDQFLAVIHLIMSNKNEQEKSFKQVEIEVTILITGTYVHSQMRNGWLMKWREYSKRLLYEINESILCRENRIVTRSVDMKFLRIKLSLSWYAASIDRQKSCFHSKWAVERFRIKPCSEWSWIRRLQKMSTSLQNDSVCPSKRSHPGAVMKNPL